MVISKAQKQRKSNKVTASQASSADAAVPNACCVHTQIRERAFEIFEKRGSGHGHDMQDWLRAERQIQTN